jgi:RHS repeat-associated protein
MKSADILRLPLLDCPDRRLQTLEDLDRDSATLSKFDYSYDAGQILSSSRHAAAEVNAYVYDDAGNRTSDSKVRYPGQPKEELIVQKDYSPNELNQIASFVSQTGSFFGVPVDSTYDLAGNLIDDGQGKTFEWDAVNRLRAVNNGSLRSEFSYDGLSRRVKIVEKAGATVTSTKQFVWVGNRIAQERDATNEVTRSYFADGEVRGNAHVGYTNYYYTRDHLGSIREMTSGSSALQAQYDYDSYGQRTKLSGALDVDFGYTGHYFDAPSGLNLTLYRAYNPALGRWLSRDPIGEAGGVNLYGYVENGPLNKSDPLGLDYILLNRSYGFHGFGHSGSLVGNAAADGYDYYTKNGHTAGSVTAHYDSVSDFWNGPYGSEYDRSLVVRTTPEKDDLMKAFANQHYNDPFSKRYNNCKNLADDIMRAGGIDPPTGLTPNAQYENLQERLDNESWFMGILRGLSILRTN